jgi:hypothetical protein
MLTEDQFWRPVDPPLNVRFREAHTRSGASFDDITAGAGISDASVFDLETYPHELMIYDASELKCFATIFQVHPRELVGTLATVEPLSVENLADAIRVYCSANQLTVDQFSDAAGWDITKAVHSPGLFLTDFSLDGIHMICHELGIDWARFIDGLAVSE